MEVVLLYIIISYLIMTGIFVEERHLSDKKLKTSSEDYIFIYISIFVLAPLVVPFMIGVLLFNKLNDLE